MICHQTGEITGSIVECVSIIGRFSITQCVTILPVKISGNASFIQRRLLPWSLNGAVVGSHPVLFEQARLASCCTSSTVRRDPPIAPIVGSTP